MKRTELTTYINNLLNIEDINDYAPNGLQVEGKDEIKKIITGVTACQALLDAAIEQQADAIIVHHGYFWKGESPVVSGIKKQRIYALLQHDINLLAYHLPLDVHPQLGNNFQLAKQLNLTIEGYQAVDGINDLLWFGSVNNSISATAFSDHISQQLQRTPLHIGPKNKNIKRLAWCTGGAQRYIEQALTLGVDAYITGEVSEPTVHIAREAGIHFFAAGHHATERYGVKALGEHLADKFDIQHQFIDIDNPV